MKVRIIYEVGAKVVLHKFGGTCGDSYHSADTVVHEARLYADAHAWMKTQNLFDVPSLWLSRCERCGCEMDAAAPEIHRSYGPERVYDSPSGKPEVNDMFTVPCPGAAPSCFDWDNCIGQHLHVICPDGCDWDIDSRAGNCSMPNERAHRCWVRTGAPPDITVGKAGFTCEAGGGSIQTSRYHGMFQNGEFHPC